MDEAIFKVYRNAEQSSDITIKTGKSYSLGQILGLGQEFLKEKIFQLDLKKDSGFKYVVMKMNKIQGKDKKILVQIIDMSAKILYNEIKAEKSFLSLINAAVSHELRNPLNSLIGQINSMQSFFENFS